MSMCTLNDQFREVGGYKKYSEIRDALLNQFLKVPLAWIEINAFILGWE